MSEQPAASRIQVEALGDGFKARAEQWASLLGLPLQLADAEFSLQVGEHGLQLQQLGPDAPGPVRVDLSRVAPRIGACTAVAAGK